MSYFQFKYYCDYYLRLTLRNYHYLSSKLLFFCRCFFCYRYVVNKVLQPMETTDPFADDFYFLQVRLR